MLEIIILIIICVILYYYIVKSVGNTKYKKLLEQFVRKCRRQWFNLNAKIRKMNTEQKKSSNRNKSNLSRKMAGSNWESAIQCNNNGIMTTVKIKNIAKNTKYVAMDCEMVGIGPGGSDNMLARVSIVNQHGEILLDKYVKPREKVSDYRTNISGIRPEDIEHASDFETVQNEVAGILHSKILVGHALSKDLAVLYIKHPYKATRDTSKYRPLAKLISCGGTPSLKGLAKAILGIDIQNGEHSSVEDARATMAVYNRVSADWEKHIRKLNNNRHFSRNSGYTKS